MTENRVPIVSLNRYDFIQLGREVPFVSADTKMRYGPIRFFRNALWRLQFLLLLSDTVALDKDSLALSRGPYRIGFFPYGGGFGAVVVAGLKMGVHWGCLELMEGTMTEAGLPHCEDCGRVEYDCRCHEGECFQLRVQARQGRDRCRPRSVL